MPSCIFNGGGGQTSCAQSEFGELRLQRVAFCVSVAENTTKRKATVYTGIFSSTWPPCRVK